MDIRCLKNQLPPENFIPSQSRENTKPRQVNCRLPAANMRASQLQNWTQYQFPFVYNQIDTELFPIEAWRECSRLAPGGKALPIWTSEAVDVDWPNLVFQLRQRLLHYREIDVAEDEILVTVGAQHALSILGTLYSGDPALSHLKI